DRAEAMIDRARGRAAGTCDRADRRPARPALEDHGTRRVHDHLLSVKFGPWHNRMKILFDGERTVPKYEIAQSYETVNLLRDGGAARTALNRPERLNAWTRALGRDLLEAITAVSSDESVRAVELIGAGRAFSAGADLKAGFSPTPAGHPDVQAVLHEL